MEILLIRHTTPAVAPGTCYGWTDLDLAADFESEYEMVRAGIQSLAWEKPLVYSSPLKRCRLAAERFARDEALKAPLLDERLREMHFGAWENRLWDEIPRDELDRWGKDFENLAPPGGESFGQVNERVLEFWNEMANRHEADARIIVFSHGGPIRCLLAHVLGMPPSRAFRLKVDYGGRGLVTLGKTENDATYVSFVNRLA